MDNLISIERLKLSVSKAKTFSDCKKKYKYTYIEKLPSKDWEHLTFGSFVHKILEDFHNYYLVNNDQYAQKFNMNNVMTLACKSALNEFKGKITKQMKAEVWELMQTYLKLIKNNFPNVIACEKDFKLSFKNNIELKGFIDRIEIINDGEIKVSDYKTSKSDKYLIDDPFQLLTYAFTLLKENPELKIIHGSYIMIRDNFKELSFKFTRNEILDVENQFLEYAVDIRKEELFEANPTFLCNYCSFVEHCNEGQKMLIKKPLISGEIDW